MNVIIKNEENKSKSSTLECHQMRFNYSNSTLLATLTLNVLSILDNDAGYIEMLNDATFNFSDFYIVITKRCILKHSYHSINSHVK